MYQYLAKVTRIIDGDTFVCDIDLGLHSHRIEHIRVNNLDTPEIFHPKSDAEKQHGFAAKAKAKELLEGNVVMLNTVKTEIYARWGADVMLRDENGEYTVVFADVMKAAGFEKLAVY